ncbi:site-specific integrase, partial [Pseudomonas amygdali]|uniref:site-specific integrase n=1 Tax=Pseudomonas amygdali TaxID=47877 RepID=UPI0013791FCE
CERGVGMVGRSSNARPSTYHLILSTPSYANKDHNDFRGAKYERPTYLYKSELKLEIARGKIKRKVANRKISSMTGYYSWKVTERKFKPDEEMWKTKITPRRYTDNVGNTQIKEVLTNDLTFTNNESISTGRFIRDGGKLYPIERPDQKFLIQALMTLNNPEMLLAHIVSLTSGTRLQSTLTLRHGDMAPGVGGNSDPNKYTLHYIEMGEGTIVETKGNKHQFVAVPAWVHNILNTYINSQRHKDRAMKSPIRDNSKQYVFLTRTGRPYYVAAADQHLFDYSAEAGSALRQFIRKVHLKLAELGASFTYRFHDLRATFGMNFLEDLTADVANGKMNQIELFDKLKHRLNHEDVTVTMAYLRYRDEHPKIAQVQMDFEIHLEELIRTRMSSHEKSRASNLQT